MCVCLGKEGSRKERGGGEGFGRLGRLWGGVGGGWGGEGRVRGFGEVGVVCVGEEKEEGWVRRGWGCEGCGKGKEEMKVSVRVGKREVWMDVGERGSGVVWARVR